MTLRLSKTEVDTVRRIVRFGEPDEVREFLNFLTSDNVRDRDKRKALESVRPQETTR